MRYPADQRERTRQRILDAAGIVFRRHGFQAASVDLVMTEAGLTAGGFYAHFKSKDDLFVETLIQALKQGRVIYGKEKEDDSLHGAERVRAIVARYLSPGHRRIVDRGCVMPPLLAELPRQSPETRQAFQDVFSDIVASLEPHLTDGQKSGKSDQALALLALMIGGLSLSRAVADGDLADRILAACRTLVDTALQHPPFSQSEQ